MEHDPLTDDAGMGADFLARAAALVGPPSGSAPPIAPLSLDADGQGTASAWFRHWDSLGGRIPGVERTIVPIDADRPLTWDAAMFSVLARRPIEAFPIAEFRFLCPYPEAMSQLAGLREHVRGRRVLVAGSRTGWLELFCAIAGAAAITSIDHREIRWHGVLDAPMPMRSLTWAECLATLAVQAGAHDLVLSYGALQHAGLGRFGGAIRPLGDLFEFMLLARCLAPAGLCALAVPVGPDLTQFNAQRIYGAQRLRALEAVSGLRCVGLARPDAAYLASEPDEALRTGWSLAALARLALGSHRQPLLCFAAPGTSLAP